MFINDSLMIWFFEPLHAAHLNQSESPLSSTGRLGFFVSRSGSGRKPLLPLISSRTAGGELDRVEEGTSRVFHALAECLVVNLGHLSKRLPAEPVAITSHADPISDLELRLLSQAAAAHASSLPIEKHVAQHEEQHKADTRRDGDHDSALSFCVGSRR